MPMAPTISEATDELGSYRVAAEDDGTVLGHATLAVSRFFPPDQPHRGEVVELETAPTHDAPELAGLLLEALVHEARRRGMRQVEIACLASDDGARRTLTGLGFVEWGRLPNATADGAMLFYAMGV